MRRLFGFKDNFYAIVLKGGVLVLVVMIFTLFASNGARAAEFVVDSTVDAVDDNPGDGLCDDGSGSCTLRAAVMESNALPGEDEIILSNEVYILTIPGVDNLAADGDLDIRDDLIITGEGADETIIDAANLTRVFHLIDDDDLVQIEVEITGLRIQNSIAGNAGGGIRNVSEIIFLEGVSIQDSTAPRGGGIYVGPDGRATVFNSAIINNSATDDPGQEWGGGIYNSGETVIINTTVSGNTAGDLGGGIFNDAGFDSVFSTIADNVTESGLAGGIHQAVGSDTQFFGTIIADNSTGDCGGVFIESLGYNVSTGDCNLTDPTDLPDTDPLIGPLQNNGGTTLTHEILEGSPAIDLAGTIRPVDGDGNGSAICDAGAFEFVPAAVVPESGGDGGCSLASPGASGTVSLAAYLLVPFFVLIARIRRRFSSL
jgi:CSLREA domain-containing protein